MESVLLEVNVNLHKELYGVNKQKRALLREKTKLLKENEIKEVVNEKSE